MRSARQQLAISPCYWEVVAAEMAASFQGKCFSSTKMNSVHVNNVNNTVIPVLAT